MYESPAAILFDVNGTAMAVSGGIAVPISTSALLFAGMSTTGVASYLDVNSVGAARLQGSLVTGSNVDTISGMGVFVGGVDSSNLFRGFRVTPDGILVASSSITGTVNVNQGNQGSVGQSWFVALTNGTNVIGTGSTAPLFVERAAHTGSSLSSVAQTTSVAALVPSASAVRHGTTIYNDATTNLFVQYGSGTVSSTLFSIKVSAQGYLEVPFEFNGPIYAVWQSPGPGNALVTEIFT